MVVREEEECNGLGKKRTTLLLGLFALATVIIFDIGSISLSFIFGSMLILISLRDYRFFFIPRGLSKFLMAFVCIAFISLTVTDVPPNRATPVRSIQLIYWLLLALYVDNSYEYIKKEILSRVVLISTLIFIILDISILSMSQNGVAFTIIIMGPLGYFCLQKYYQKCLYAVALLFLILLNGSRSAAVISVVQTVIAFILFTPRIQNKARLWLVVFIVIVLSINLAPIRKTLGNFVYPINKEVGTLLINPESVFRNDMSWLIRKAQINKGFQIYEQYPVFGIGIFNFPRYNIDIDVSNIETDRRVIRSIDNRSSHNVYIGLLSETGILGFSTIILMFIFALVSFIKRMNDIKDSFEGCVFISFIGLLIYFYTVANFFGTSSWIVYGLILGASTRLTSIVSYN